MRKFGLLGTSAIGSAAFVGMTLAFASPAFAQTPTPAQTEQDDDDEGVENDDPDTLGQNEVELESGEEATRNEEILVTGSRIRRPNLESNVPITSVSAEDLLAQGDPNIGDALNDLPSLRSTFSQSNSVRFIGTTGLNILDLRGLGTARTLVLVNGRRHITAVPGDFTVDINTIPSDLIERVDVITGGSSAVYGSDAVAGVVNFVLKRDFDGIRLRAQSGISQQGDRGISFASLTAGRNFLDDRANIAVNLEYVNAEPLYFRDRPEMTGSAGGRCQFNLAEPTAGEPPQGDGVPDNVFFCGVRNAAISNGGTLAAPISVAACQNPNITAANRPLCLNPGTPLGAPRLFNFDRSGNLVEVLPTLDFRPFGSGNIIQAADSPVPGATLRDTGQIAPGLDRYTANVLFNFELSEAFNPFAEAKYVRVDALQESQPSFFQASFPAFFGGGRGLRCDNPFLTPQNLAALRSVNRCLGTTPAALANETLPLGRFNVDFGGRSEKIRRETYRFVGGVRGDFNDDWNYEASFNYGHVNIHQDQRNNLLIFDINGNEAGFLSATDAIRDPVTGQIVCRDPAARAAGCVPINVFGSGRPSQEALNFINTVSFIDQKASQYNAVAYVNGDTSQVFEFPGGPARFVIGGEYRRETAFYEADPLSASGGTFFNAFAAFDPPALVVKEAFGELEFPLLRDMPFAQELTITGAARYSDYNKGAGTAGSTFAWNVNGTWAPVQDIRLRANYSKSVRVPTLSDLFTPPTQSFAFLADPCDVLNIGNSPNRAANCAAAGVPVGFVNTFARTQTTEIQISGNPTLSEETGKSLTVGGVLTPRWVPGLSITADYYRIRVTNLIATLGGQTILNQCFDLPDPNNQFCALIFPRQANFEFAQPALISGGVNFAKFVADGIDLEVAYRKTLENGNRINIRGIATKVLKRTNFTSPTNPLFGDRILGELGDPEWAANLNVVYGFGKFDLRYSLNYIGKQTIGAYESYFPFQGRPPQNADLTAEVWYPDVMYHALRLNMKVNDRFQFYMGADNIFDAEPRLFRNTFGSTGTAGGSAWDYIGRYFYAGAQVDF
jgi:outer membrane receptor protein involved in Fe transport